MTTAAAGRRGAVVIIEESGQTAAPLADVLREEGFSAQHCRTGQEGIETCRAARPVAVFVDWVLSDVPGIEVCRSLRAEDPILPIVFVSGRDDETSVSRGLDAGADDFLIRPFRHRELMARLEAHLRKASAAAGRGARPDPSSRSLYRLGEIEVDLAAHQVQVAGEGVALGTLEFKLLEYLCRNAGIALSRDQIMNQVYGWDPDISTDRVDVLVRRLRAKLGPGPRRGQQLVAVPGYGYRLERRQLEDARRPA